MAQFCKDRSDGLHTRGGGFQGFLGGSGANFGTGEYLVGLLNMVQTGYELVS